MQKITVYCIYFMLSIHKIAMQTFLLSFKFMWNLHEQTFLFYSQKVFVIFAI